MPITTTKSWPAGLPCVLREGHSTQHGSPLVRTSMASGRARQRRAFTSVPSVKKVSWIFSGPQCLAFEAWFRDTISDGAEWFNMDLRTPLGISTPLVCRFTDMYEGPDIEAVDSWRVSAVLEVWTRPIIDGDWGLLPDFLLGVDIFDVAMNREWPAS